jgi:lipopolysaccharide transport system ATP-binding protein
VTAVAIRAENLAKRYAIGRPHEAYGTLRDALSSAASEMYASLRGKSKRQPRPEIWALRGVSVDARPGEVLGVIGANGSGKTTLLKILSRVTRPSEGRAWIHGRVGSLLEVGTGFHPELTGRENVFLNGAILGMRKVEIERRFDEIVAFAEIDEFLDTPVKRYSTGMFMRLAFSVAAHLEPEILLVDEVLAVGDAAFQRRSLGEMGNVARQGRTIVFVSHNMAAVQTLCHRVIWLDRGRIVAEGAPRDVLSRYLQTSSVAATERLWDDPSSAPGNDHIRMRRVRVLPVDGAPTDPITIHTASTLEFEFWNLVPDAYLDVNLQLVSETGIVAFGSSPTDDPRWEARPFVAGLYATRCEVPANLLMPGRYHVRFSVVRDGHHVLYQQDDVLVFDVHDAGEVRGGWFGERVGVVRPLLDWKTDLLTALR